MTQQPPPDWQQYGYQPPPQWAPPAGPVPPSAAPAAKKKRRKWPWVLGAILLLFVIVGVSNGGNSAPQTPTAAGNNADPSPPAAAAPATPAEEADDSASGSTVVYEVTGKGSASVTYMKEGFSQEQQTSAKLPFRKELKFEDEIGPIAPLSLVAQHSSGSGDITCRITVDGEVVGESTSSGQYAVVTCNANG